MKSQILSPFAKNGGKHKDVIILLSLEYLQYWVMMWMSLDIYRMYAHAQIRLHTYPVLTHVLSWS